MARKIDFSNPLSAEDQAYVADRPWLLVDAKLRGEDIINDDEFGVEDDDEDNENTGEEGAPQSPEDTGTEGEDGDDDQGDDDADDAPEDGEDDTEDVAPYDEWDYADLKTEAGNRGLSKAGSKEQLIERLQEDDGSDSE